MSDHLKLDFYQSTPHKPHQTHCHHIADSNVNPRQWWWGVGWPPVGWGWGCDYITHTPTHPLHTVMYTIKYSMVVPRLGKNSHIFPFFLGGGERPSLTRPRFQTWILFPFTSLFKSPWPLLYLLFTMEWEKVPWALSLWWLTLPFWPETTSTVFQKISPFAPRLPRWLS